MAIIRPAGVKLAAHNTTPQPWGEVGVCCGIIGLRPLLFETEEKTMTQNAEMARYYGNLRFAMFTVFTAIVGALVLLPFDKDRADLMLIEPQKYFFGISGIILPLASF